MPKTPIDYSKTIIYKLEHIENEDLVYVGHTTSWDEHKYQHKSRCNNEKDKKFNLKVYQMIRENGGWDCFQMLEVEKYPCKDKREAEKRETEIMKELKPKMNSNNSYITEDDLKEYHKKYNIINKELRSIKNKEYRENNIEKLKEKEKEYRENNKELIKQRYHHNINKDRFNENMREYYENNKTKLNEKQKQYYENYKIKWHIMNKTKTE